MAYTGGAGIGTDGNQRISMGLSLGLINRRFDQSKLQTNGMNDDNTGQSITSPFNESLNQNLPGSISDAGAGIVYYDATLVKR